MAAYSVQIQGWRFCKGFILHPALLQHDEQVKIPTLLGAVEIPAEVGVEAIKVLLVGRLVHHPSLQNIQSIVSVDGVKDGVDVAGP